MEKQKLPNEKAVMILALLSFIGCCCTSGGLGIVLSGIGLYLAIKDEKLFVENPDVYTMGSMNTWKVICIVSMVISVLCIIYWIYMRVTGQDVEQEEQLKELLRQFQNK